MTKEVAIDAAPISAEIADDLREEVIVKANRVMRRLGQGANFALALRPPVERLRDFLMLTGDFTAADLVVLHTHYVAVEAHTMTVLCPEGRKELPLDAISMIDDLFRTLIDLAATYPGFRQAAALMEPQTTA